MRGACNAPLGSPSGHNGPKLYIYICGGNPQPEAIGHTRTCLQPESGGRHRACTVTMHSLQPRQLGNDSLLNMVPIPPLGRCVEGPPLVKLYG